MPSELPPEVWLSVFEHATHVPGTLVPDADAYASHVGSFHSYACLVGFTPSKNLLHIALQTKLALVSVCKEWWRLATPFLYTSVYIGSALSLYSLSRTLSNSAVGGNAQPYGGYTQRLDIAIYNEYDNPSFETSSLATVVRCMPRLAIVSFATIENYYFPPGFGNDVLDALQHSSSTLRVLDWSASHRAKPSASRIVDFLDKCTQLRILNWPDLIWSKELENGSIPPTVSSLRLRTLTPPPKIPHFNPSERRLAGPLALQELILDVDWNLHYLEDLLEVFSSQLLSVQLYVPSYHSISISDYLHLLADLCPDLRRLTLATDLSFIRPRLGLPAITYLGLRATRAQLSETAFEGFIAFLEEVRSRVPSLRVVQLLNENHVQWLLKAHTKLAVDRLQPIVDAETFRVEDPEGFLLTGARTLSEDAVFGLTEILARLDRLMALGCI